MILSLLTPFISERFLTDARYRDGHLRVVNALPSRRVLGLHAPEMKQVAKQLSRSGGVVELPDGACRECQSGAAVIRSFEEVPSASLCWPANPSARERWRGCSKYIIYIIYH